MNNKLKLFSMFLGLLEQILQITVGGGRGEAKKGKDDPGELNDSFYETTNS